jgi:hypothetical protein
MRNQKNAGTNTAAAINKHQIITVLGQFAGADPHSGVSPTPF